MWIELLTVSGQAALVAVVAAALGPQQVLTLHLPLQAGDVAVAEVFAQLLHLLKLQQVDPQHLCRRK